LRNALIALSLLLFLVAWNRGIALLYGLFALVLAVLLVSLAAPRFSLRRLSAQRSYPAQLNQGERLPVKISVRNGGWFSRYLIELEQASPGYTEPETATALLPSIKTTRHITLDVPCERRGLHALPPLVAKSGYPLGVREASITLCNDGPEILVYPTPFALDHFPYVSGAHMPVAGVQAVALSGGSHEFIQVREYQAGDSPRHIHWPQTARHNTLMVREHEFTAAAEVTLLLDLHRAADVGEGVDTTLEYAVKIAASVAQHACAAGHRVRLLGYGAETVCVPAGGGRAHVEAIFDVLARVQADGDVRYETAISQALAESAPGSVMVLFHSPPHSAKEAEPPLFYARHVRPVWIRFDSHSFLKPIQVGRRSAFERIGDVPIYTIRRGDDLAAVFGTAS
jgi:uncharacterized protein (DUF58 family)